MNNTTRTIDCTPTWSGILPVILALIQNPNTKKDGLHELQRMAELADAYVAENQKTDMKEQIAKIITECQNAITEYFEMEVPMENDADNMNNFLEDLKAEILELIK